MNRKPKYDYEYDRPRSNPSSNNKPLGKKILNYTQIAIIGGIFILGMVVGIGFTSTASFNAENVASREVIDRSAPNAELCVQFGASAVVSDVRVFVTFNPFNVYISQPMMQPGCVLRSNNWAILEKQNLVTSQQVNDCKNRMNTFGFTGPLEAKPRIDCVYQNEAAGNLFTTQPGAVGPRPQTENF